MDESINILNEFSELSIHGTAHDELQEQGTCDALLVSAQGSNTNDKP